MEPSSEKLPHPETQLKLNPDLVYVVNEALTVSLNDFEKQKSGRSNYTIDQFRENMGIICDVFDYNQENQSNQYQVHNQLLDNIKNAFYISLVPADKINHKRLNRHGEPIIDLTKGPVIGCQVLIEPHSEKKGKEIPRDPSVILETGFRISVRTVKYFLNDEGKFQFDPQDGALRIISLFDDTAKCSLLYPKIMPNFKTKDIPVKPNPSIVKRNNEYMRTLGFFNR
jgi:hypothetical protein